MARADAEGACHPARARVRDPAAARGTEVGAPSLAGRGRGGEGRGEGSAGGREEGALAWRSDVGSAHDLRAYSGSAHSFLAYPVSAYPVSAYPVFAYSFLAHPVFAHPLRALRRIPITDR
jgi:hypothetical protein